MYKIQLQIFVLKEEKDAKAHNQSLVCSIVCVL